MSSISLTAVIGVSEGSCGCEGNSTGTEVSFEGGSLYFERVVRSDTAINIASTTFVQLPLADDMTSVSFVSLAAVDGTSLVLLIGEPAAWLGSGGTFPTGFVGGETFTFLIQTYNTATGGYDTDDTIAIVFGSGDQTAVDVARRINAQLALNGYPSLANVVSGQITIDGVEPGANKRLANSVANAVIGFDSAHVGANGTGTALTMTGVLIAQLDAIPGESFWVKGPGSLTILLAGT